MDELTPCKGSATSKKRNNCVDKFRKFQVWGMTYISCLFSCPSFMFSWIYHLIVLKMFWIVIFPNCKICREDLSLECFKNICSFISQVQMDGTFICNCECQSFPTHCWQQAMTQLQGCVSVPKPTSPAGLCQQPQTWKWIIALQSISMVCTAIASFSECAI